MKLLSPLSLGNRTARNRIVFGPHETNLGTGRSLSAGHLAYYRQRAVGGAGVIVLEEASTHSSDWPYERCPLATACGEIWATIGAAIQKEGALAIAALGHSGGQGSSAYSQAPLWAPSMVPEVVSREVPKSVETEEIAALVASVGEATRLAVAAGLDGVEVNAGQHSLVRQFLSGLTNHRGDEYGLDRLRFAREVLSAARAAAGSAIVGLRLSCDELIPWGGIMPEDGARIAAALAEYVDYIVVVRGSIYSTWATRPDLHVEPGFNLTLAGRLRAALPARVAVIAQGSIVDVNMAEQALTDGVCDGIEMTRAQIADPLLAAKAAAGQISHIRPCILCNQACQVRDVRNPIVSCVGEPFSGHETEDPPVDGKAEPAVEVVVVGGGPAGLECARVAALRGHHVQLFERSNVLGGALRAATNGMGRSRLIALVEWLENECRELGVRITLGREIGSDDIRTLMVSEETEWYRGERHASPTLVGSKDADATGDRSGVTPPGWGVSGVASVSLDPTGPPPRSVPGSSVNDRTGVVVLCTGSRPGYRDYTVEDGALVYTAREVLESGAEGESALSIPDGPVAVWDPTGGPIALSVAELLAAQRMVTLVTPDLMVGKELSRCGDLVPANMRLHAAGVRMLKRALLREVHPSTIETEDRFSGLRQRLEAVVLIDCGPLLPDDALWRDMGMTLARAGDAVAPRSIYEAILEGRRCALSIGGSS